MSENKLSKTAIRECRAHFLRAAAKDPNIQLGQSLYEEVFKPSQALWAELGLPLPRRPSSEFTPEQWIASEQYGLKQWCLIEDWATRRHLPYEWVYRAALDTLAFRFSPEYAFREIPGYTPPDGSWPVWAFGRASERDYRNRMQLAVDAYIRDVKRTRKKFLSDGHAQDAHYHWAALNVCLGWKLSEIAIRWSSRTKLRKVLTRQAVQKYVRPILQQIGISVSTT